MAHQPPGKGGPSRRRPALPANGFPAPSTLASWRELPAESTHLPRGFAARLPRSPGTIVHVRRPGQRAGVCQSVLPRHKTHRRRLKACCQFAAYQARVYESICGSNIPLFPSRLCVLPFALNFPALPRFAGSPDLAAGGFKSLAFVGGLAAYRMRPILLRFCTRDGCRPGNFFSPLRPCGPICG